ncbi:MAG: hypothetical protein R3F56_20850 [Planctomycetota bacterium]
MSAQRRPEGAAGAVVAWSFQGCSGVAWSALWQRNNTAEFVPAATIRSPCSSGGLLAQLGEHLLGRRELVVHGPLVPDLAAVGGDDEVTAAAGLQVDLCFGEGLLDVGAQTGRPRQVVSNDAVFDADLHGQSCRESSRRA